MCHQQRLRSACTSVQSDQSLCWSHVPSTAQGYPKRDKWEPLPNWVNEQADLSLSGNMSYCRFCHALAQMKILMIKGTWLSIKGTIAPDRRDSSVNDFLISPGTHILWLLIWSTLYSLVAPCRGAKWVPKKYIFLWRKEKKFNIFLLETSLIWSCEIHENDIIFCCLVYSVI